MPQRDRRRERTRPSRHQHVCRRRYDVGMIARVDGDAAEVFRTDRHRLFALAYRLLGSASDAEDVLQSAFEKWVATDRNEVSAPAAWLTTVVTNLCLRQLGSVRRQRERYTGSWLPEPVLTSGGALGPLETAELRESVSFGLLTLMERLTAPERAVFVLREAFGYRYAEIAGILGRPEAGCRQLHRRAVQRLGRPSRRFQPDPGQWRLLTERFLAAAAGGDLAGMERLLTEDAVSETDGAGSDLAFPRKPVTGRYHVARFFTRLHLKYATELKLSVAEVNGQPALLSWRGRLLFAVIVPEFDGMAVAALPIVASPAKLAFAARQMAVTDPGPR